MREAIQRIERQTSAEVVVAVRRQAGLSYLDVDLLAGALASFVALVLLLFLDHEFATAWIPLDVVIAFTGGLLACRNIPSLRRRLVSRHRRREEASRTAAKLFHELGVGRTSGRNGILVVFAAFEKQVAVQADVGIDPAVLRPCVDAFERAMSGPRAHFEAFLAALESMGPLLVRSMPRQDDDVNELPDEVA